MKMGTVMYAMDQGKTSKKILLIINQTANSRFLSAVIIIKYFRSYAIGLNASLSIQ